jgi:hypothetical protein
MIGSQKRARVVFEVGLCLPGLPYGRHNPSLMWLYSTGHTETRAIVTLERCVR